MIAVPRSRADLSPLNLLFTTLTVLALVTGTVLSTTMPAAAAGPSHEAGHPADNVTDTHTHGRAHTSDNFTYFPGFIRYTGPVSRYTAGAASTYWINGDSGSDNNTGSQAFPWKTIQYALDNVAPGDTIRVVGISNTGTVYYDETLVINKDVTIIGDGPDSTWLEPDVNSDNTSVISLTSPGLNVSISGIYILGYYNNTDEGGCISASGDNLTLQSMVFENDNVNTEYGGAVYVDNCTLTMNGCIVYDAYARYGSGLYALDSGVNLADCFFIICGGTNSDYGGAIYLDASALKSSHLNAERCSFYDNHAYWYGGGIFIHAFHGDCTIDLSNCTLNYNYTDDGGGAGIYVESNIGAASVTLTACTFYVNEADGNGGGLLQYGSNSATTISNCIFDNFASIDGDNIDIESGTAVSNYSLYSDTPNFALGANDIPDTDSLCYWMADNGGTTPTCAIDSTSPARGAGSNAGLTTDQRGVARGLAYDIGAYQWVGPTYASASGNDANSGLTALAPKQHIYAAANLAGPGSATYVASGTYKDENHFDAYELQYVNIDIHKPLTLTGTDGAASTIIDDSLPKVSGDDTIICVFDATEVWPDGAVSVSGFTLANAGGGGCFGGGLFINEQYGITSVRDCVIQGNHADFGGGGVYIEDSGDVHLLRCIIRNNSASGFGGGGIYSSYNDNVTISNCEINGNTTDADGGGICGMDLPDTSIFRCTVNGNSADGYGGGIYLSYVTWANVVVMEACTLSNNQAGVNGGGLLNERSSFGITPPSVQLTNCTIYGNSLPGGGSGGGIYNSGHAELRNCTISSNDAGPSGSGGGYFEEGTFKGISKNTILAVNTAGTGHPDDIAAGPVYDFESDGHNICTTYAPAFFNQPTDKNTTNPGLGPLQDNGGPTFTCAIGATSPAFNTAVDGPATDQRGTGYPRPACGGYDIGAYELQTLVTPTPTITAVNPNSGRWGEMLAVTITGTNFTGAMTVSFGPDITVTFTVVSPTQIDATISIATGATLGERNISVTSPQGTGTGVGAFTVQPNMVVVGSRSHGGSSGSGGGSSGQGGPGMTTVGLPNIVVQNAAISTTRVPPGGAVTITANVANKGTADGTSAVKVYVNGQEEAVQGITVNSGSNRPISFTVSRNEPGTYIVYVGGIQAGSFTVDQVVDPDMILLISSVLILSGLVLGGIYIMKRRRSYY